MSTTRIGHPVHPVWTPADAAALREVAEQYPREIGQSPMLHFILEREGITL